MSNDDIRALLEAGQLTEALSAIFGMSVERARVEIDWPALVAQARDCQPEALFSAMKYLSWNPANYPQVVAAWMADVETHRHKQGRPTATVAAVRAWQRHRARHIYTVALELYRQVKASDADGEVRWEEVYSAAGVCGLRMTRGKGGASIVAGSGMPPQAFALQMVADAMSVSEAAAQKMVFGRYRK